MDFKTLLVYAIIVAVVAVAVAYVLSTQISSVYSISVTLLANVPATPYPYETAYLTVYINNTGSSTATGMPLLVYLDGTPVRSYKVTLPPRSGGSVSLNYTFPSNGLYEFQAIADPGHLLKISNRSAAQGSVSIDVNAPQAPSVYSSVPNNDITYTQSFSLLQNGSAFASTVALGYNISVLRDIFGPARTIMLRTLYDLSDTINLVDGATAYYPGNQIAYTAWVQGTTTPALVGAIVNSFSVPESPTNANGTKAGFARVSNTTSICFYYSNGWTKIVSYYNASTSSTTCAGIISTTHSGTANALVIGRGNQTAMLSDIAPKFVYLNSTYLGSALTYGNGTYGAASIFANQYGTFISYLKKNAEPVNISANYTCNGIIYPANNIYVCSSGVSTIHNSSEADVLINETEVTQNYTASLYSFVNRSTILLANNAGIDLLLSLNLSNRSAGWVSTLVNVCGIFNVSLPCRVVSFSHTNYTAVIGLTNNMTTAVKITKAACFAPGLKKSQNVSVSIAPGQTADLMMSCINVPIPLQTVSTTYDIALNYTQLGVAKNATGRITVANS